MRDVPPSETERDLQRLEAALKQLEAEYNMFFAGRSKRPPWETRSRVEALIKRYDRAFIQNYGDRFRFQSLQARFMTFVDLWDRGLKARDEGRPGALAQKAPAPPTQEPRSQPSPSSQVVHVASFRRPAEEGDKLRALYDSLDRARREAGQPAVPYSKFVQLVETQVARLQSGAGSEVALRVAVKDGKVTLTARAMKGARQASDD